MISVNKCKIILNNKSETYTDEEVEIIRVVLYNLVEIIHNDLTKSFQKHPIQTKQNHTLQDH